MTPSRGDKLLHADEENGQTNGTLTARDRDRRSWR